MTTCGKSLPMQGSSSILMPCRLPALLRKSLLLLLPQMGLPYRLRLLRDRIPALRRRKQLSHVHHRKSNCRSWRCRHPLWRLYHRLRSSVARQKGQFLGSDLGYVRTGVMLRAPRWRCLYRASDMEMVLLPQPTGWSCDSCGLGCLLGELSPINVSTKLDLVEEDSRLGSAW